MGTKWTEGGAYSTGLAAKSFFQMQHAQKNVNETLSKPSISFTTIRLPVSAQL